MYFLILKVFHVIVNVVDDFPDPNFVILDLLR